MLCCSIAIDHVVGHTLLGRCDVYRQARRELKFLQHILQVNTKAPLTWFI